MAVSFQNEKLHHSEKPSELIINIINWVKYILSKWKVIMAFAVLGAIIGFIYYKSHKGVYTAEYSFIITGEKVSNGGYAGIASQLGVGMSAASGSVFDENNIVSFFKSRSIIEKVLYMPVDKKGSKELIIDKYMNINGVREKWKGTNIENIDFKKNTPDKRKDSLITQFYKQITSKDLIIDKPDRKSDIMYARFTSQDQVFSKVFLESLMNQVTEFYKVTKISNSINNIKILQNQLDSIKYNLNTSITGAAVSLDRTPFANPSQQVTRVASQKKVVDAEMNKLIMGEIVKNLEMSKVELLKQGNLLQIIDYPVLPLDLKRSGLMKCMLIGVLLSVVASVAIIIVVRFILNIKYLIRNN